MRPLGPFGAAPRLAVGVSGGADSTCLALLAHEWASARGGSAAAIVIDHGLRQESKAEAVQTTGRLLERGIVVWMNVLRDLAPGSALAERARDARLGVFAEVCGENGIAHLLLGHHANDQAETVIIRQLAGSGEAGLAGMAAVTHARWGRIVRPLLTVAPARLRMTLVARRMKWVEDPSNRDVRATRPRVRGERGDLGGDGLATRALVAEAIDHGEKRAMTEAEDARATAASVEIRPEGFAILDPASLSASALSALIRTISGSRYAPSLDRCAALVARPRAATLGGARLLTGGRVAPGRWLLLREARAMASPVAAEPGSVWDGRWRINERGQPSPNPSRDGRGEVSCFLHLLPSREEAGRRGPRDANDIGTIGALGLIDLTRLRREIGRLLPVAIMATLPAIRRDGALVAVPLVGWPDEPTAGDWPITFEPSRPAVCAPFTPAPGRDGTGA